MDEEENIIFIPHEDHVLTIPYETRVIDVQPEIRELEISDMLQSSKTHGAGDTIRWRVEYGYWLDNAAEITGMQIASSSADLGVINIQMLGRHIYFMLTGGQIGEQAKLSLAMTDNFGNVKHDTVNFTVVAP